MTNYAALKLLSHCQTDNAITSETLQHKFKLSMNLKNINIVDPCLSKNNLGKSISLYNSYRLKEAFEMRNKRLQQIYKKTRKMVSKGGQDGEQQARSYLIERLCSQFKYTMECTGMVPPLQLKMPQIVIKSSKFSNNAKNQDKGSESTGNPSNPSSVQRFNETGRNDV